MVLVFFIPLESQNIDTMTFPADESETSFEGKSLNLGFICDINLLKKIFWILVVNCRLQHLVERVFAHVST
jgi:hypothetical protein